VVDPRAAAAAAHPPTATEQAENQAAALRLRRGQIRDNQCSPHRTSHPRPRLFSLLASHDFGELHVCDPAWRYERSRLIRRRHDMADTFDASLRDLRREKAGLEADLKAGTDG